MSSATSTRAFAPFEWMVALRYLRARRKEGFISVIAGFSFIGIMLGVATLIIVMAVMNGFRQELFDKMLGLNGHVVVHSLGEFTDYDEVANRVRKVEGVKYALPLVEGQVLISTPYTSSGALVRGLREADLKSLTSIYDNIRFGTLDGFDDNPGLACIHWFLKLLERIGMMPFVIYRLVLGIGLLIFFL
jgi:lipoprotein-releasing system permease protein